MSARREWTLPNELAALAATARAVRAHLEQAGLDAERVHALDLALEELVGNTIRYGYPDGGRHAIRIALELDEREVRLTLRDDARPFDPTAQPEPAPPASLAAAPAGGRGIRMVRRLIADMRYRRERAGNTLVLVLPRRA